MEYKGTGNTEVLSFSGEIKKELIKIKKTHKKQIRKKVIVGILSTILIIGGTGLVLLYGPISYFRELLITSAMTTLKHQYLATMFYDSETINKVLANNVVVETGDSTNTDLIKITNVKSKYKTYADEYDKDILTKVKGNDLYKIINIKGNNYVGYLVAIYDPSKVSLASTKYLGVKGQHIDKIVEENNAILGINGGGFYDPEWNGNGGTPVGTLIEDGKIIRQGGIGSMGGGIIGFTKENKLFLGKVSAEEAINKGVVDAIDFGPYLIVNGKPSFIKGNGGWGIAPRTAIGQRKDGIVLFLVIDGRRSHSVGATMVDVTEIMSKYKAYNAANLDGGASTALIEKNKIINIPVAMGKDGLRSIPNAWIVKE